MPEPYKIKAVEPIRMLTRPERSKRLAEAGYNTFLLRSEDVTIDLLTDSGTNAMTDRQWAALMMGDEAYAGSASFERFAKAVSDVYGYPFVVPTHQGRGAEHLLSKSLITPGDTVPGNMYFTTTRLHQELAGARFEDVIIDEAHDPAADHPFKGNVDLKKFAALVKRVGAERVPYITVGCPVNLAGGQPVSLENLREVAQFCRSKKIMLVIDGARAVENAFFIQEREKACRGWSVARILKEMCALADTISVSAKKDLYVNIGGFLATRDEALFKKAAELCVVYEGLHTYGGLAGRDLEAMAVGAREMVQDEWVAHRVAQVRYLGARLEERGIPIVKPVGGHGVFVDAKAFLPHLGPEDLIAQSLAAWIYEDSGVRGMERGVVSAGRDEKGRNRPVKLELVRLTLPRRVYTQTHLDFVAAGIAKTWERRMELPGLRFVSEPKMLRFFQSRFAPAKVASGRR
ncbi:MAG: tryptophanase [Elusimicrobia bacterium]|nr:tryptophanase [Elusimicrobiota bacterium]